MSKDTTSAYDVDLEVVIRRSVKVRADSFAEAARKAPSRAPKVTVDGKPFAFAPISVYDENEIGGPIVAHCEICLKALVSGVSEFELGPRGPGAAAAICKRCKDV